MCVWPDRAICSTWDMQCDGDGDGTLSTQGGHGPLSLCLIAGGFNPGAAQVRQLVELDTVLFWHCGAGWCWTFCRQTEMLRYGSFSWKGAQEARVVFWDGLMFACECVWLFVSISQPCDELASCPASASRPLTPGICSSTPSYPERMDNTKKY